MGIKYSVNEKFFDVWTENMAYVLGLWYADGSIEYAPKMRGHYIRLSSIDYSLVEKVKKALTSEHKITEGHFPNQKGHKNYLLRIGNKILFKAILNRGVYERKSLIIKFPLIPKNYLASFIRGYFDGDGCVHIETNGRGEVKRLTTIFTCGNVAFLENLQTVLYKHAGTTIDRKISTTKSLGTASQLRYGTRDSIRLFLFMYPKAVSKCLHLSRKYDIFVRYLRLRDLALKDLSNVLQSQGPMVKR